MPIRCLTTLLALTIGAGVTAYADPGSAEAARRTDQIAGTSCQAFPADSYWHADISGLPEPPRSNTWLSHMSTSRRLHPNFGPSYGDGPDYGMPVTVVSGAHRKVEVSFGYASESDHVLYPFGSLSRPPMGARCRLDSSFSAAGFDARAKVVIAAMNRYGLVLADNGSPWYFQGERNANWPDRLIADLKRIPASAFVAVDSSGLMVSRSSGAVVERVLTSRDGRSRTQR